jgi:hypothetical protein
MAQPKPVAKFRAGQLSSALWANDVTVSGRKVTILKATVERRFKDANGEWRSSGSFSRNEIPLAVYCLQKAFEAIIEQANQRPDDTEDAEEAV